LGEARRCGLADQSFLDRFSLSAAVAELERLGFVYEGNGIVHARGIWCDAALAGSAERFAVLTE
jgi:hypothetical protein